MEFEYESSDEVSDNRDNTDNPLERNMILGSESALAQLNLSVIFVMARVRASNL